ncbi:MAG: F0F1 ATP synthase subunit B [Candidatus Omnitrophota bacterium]|jgi:F-type H+-transporting ATPase subunit b
MGLLELLNTNEVLAQALSFLILLFLLRAFAWKKILKLLDERKDKIAAEFKRIEEEKRQLSDIRTDYETKLSAIEEIAAKKIEDALAEGRKITDEIRKDAQLQAQLIINDARENIKYELSRAKEELKEKIVDLTIRATENVIEERLSGEQDKKLVEQFLDKIDGIE